MTSAYLVVSAIPYEQPDILAVWLSEDAANAHKDHLEREWQGARSHLVAPGLPPFAVWPVPLEPPSGAASRIKALIDQLLDGTVDSQERP